MSWKDILCFADASANGLARGSMAGALAHDLGAYLELCTPALMPVPLRDEARELYADLTERAATLAREDAGKLLSVVRASYLDIEARIDVDTPETTLAGAARLAASMGQGADLVVVGQPIKEDRSALDEALFKGALLGSGRPVLVLPRWNQPQTIGTRVLIAWKDGREAARAVNDALPLLTGAKAVALFHDGDESNDMEIAGLARIARHLAHHGVAVSDTIRTETSGNAGLSIIAAADAFEADLIVMGGYSHTRAVEWAVGGATRTLMQRSNVALLLSH